MTKRHLIALAREIAAIPAEHRLPAAEAVCRVARLFNPRFNEDRFLAACMIVRA